MSRSRSSRSSEPNGSSSSSTLGSGARARASETRWASPPDSVATSRPSKPDKPTSSSTSATRRRRSATGTLAMRSPNATLPSTSKCGNNTSSWNIRPMPRWSGRWPVRSRPSSSIRPASSGCSPAAARSRVVLPQPDGPSSTTISPSPTARSTPSSANVVSKRTWAPVMRSVPPPVPVVATALTLRTHQGLPGHNFDGRPADRAG